MNRKAKYGILMLLVLLPLSASAKGLGRNIKMNNPYVDEKRFHFGFSLGMNLMSFSVTDSEEEINGEVYHARVSNLTPGFNVGFITDMRLCRHLNLRLCPTLYFGSRTLSYITESGNPVQGSPGNGEKTDQLSMPIGIPLYLKWSAEREGNYRPYLIAGGGASYNVSRNRERPILLEPWDYFVEVGFGTDLYLQWFKLCPEIKYQIGFANILAPVDGRMELTEQDQFYTRALRRLSHQMLTITFNFE